MLLENKVAVIYGAGGPIGGAVARAFAREGARMFLAGRTLASLDKVADEIRSFLPLLDGLFVCVTVA
jgi:NADP-dependent 3-hydroxy acid dehydrogenase YdfG